MKSFCHTPRHTESVTIVHLANFGPCYTRFASLLNVQSRDYVLRTSHTEWSVEETVRTYWRLTELEATFQSLKSELGLRPVWHQLSKRIEGHLFIAVLALYDVNVIRTRLAAHGINHKWATLRTKLGRWQRTYMPQKRIRKLGKP